MSFDQFSLWVIKTVWAVCVIKVCFGELSPSYVTGLAVVLALPLSHLLKEVLTSLDVLFGFILQECWKTGPSWEEFVCYYNIYLVLS